MPGLFCPIDDQHIAIMNAGITHRIAGHTQEVRCGRTPHAVIMQVKFIGLIACGRAGKAGRNGLGKKRECVTFH
ncbi:hypothetical protein W824_09050 [Clavibacter cf. michiganensis LMG 26808]|nr:hypothetical protein W824_09050 [Clavibacter cf. michiganensis LMG 26808]